jgi:hypothetical protein
LLKNLEFVIPNGVCEARFLRPVRFAGVRNLSFLGILIEEGFIAQKTCDGKSHLASPACRRQARNDGGTCFSATG